MVILILPVPSGVQPGTFGSGCSALLTVQATSDRCKQCPDDQSDRMRPETSKGVHYRPPPFTKDECDLCHILRQSRQRRDTAVQGQPERSHLAWQARGMPTRKRQPSPKARQAQQHQRRQASATEPPGPARRASRMSAEQLLERIGSVRVVHQEAEAELALLVDHAVGLGIGWPEIASRLGVSRQAARQQYQRRHRGDDSPEDGSA